MVIGAGSAEPAFCPGAVIAVGASYGGNASSLWLLRAAMGKGACC